MDEMMPRPPYDAKLRTPLGPAPVTISKQATMNATPADPLAQRETRRCPKCAGPTSAGAAACARCGLLTERFDAFASERAAADAEFPLEALWSACRDGWEDPRRHDALLDAAAQASVLPILAGRYRRALDERPDDAVAPRRLAQITLLLEHAARAQARSGDSRTFSKALWALGYAVAGALLLSSAWVAAIAFRHHG
jgi:hypothetical protein